MKIIVYPKSMKRRVKDIDHPEEVWINSLNWIEISYTTKIPFSPYKPSSFFFFSWIRLKVAWDLKPSKLIGTQELPKMDIHDIYVNCSVSASIQ